MVFGVRPGVRLALLDQVKVDVFSRGVDHLMIRCHSPCACQQASRIMKTHTKIRYVVFTITDLVEGSRVRAMRRAD